MSRAVIPHPLRIEAAARDATAYLPDGRLWCAKGQLPDDDRWPVGVCVLIWLALLAPLWAGVIAVLRWAL